MKKKDPGEEAPGSGVKEERKEAAPSSSCNYLAKLVVPIF
jgi:hypothetical protein